MDAAQHNRTLSVHGVDHAQKMDWDTVYIWHRWHMDGWACSGVRDQHSGDRRKEGEMKVRYRLLPRLV